MSEIDEMKSWVMANAMQSRRPEFGAMIYEALGELDQLRRDFALLQVSQATVVAEIGKLRHELEKARAEVADLEEERAEAVELHSRILSEQCPTDEYHCTCVPTLRAEIERLRGMLSTYIDFVQAIDRDGIELWQVELVDFTDNTVKPALEGDK